MAAQTDIFFNLNLIDKTTAGAATAQRTINNVGRSYQKVADNTVAIDKTQRAMFRGMRGQWGQVGHQIQDIAVQLQMGQNAMLVFGQQGSQIASLMGPGGAIVGGILAVGAAMLSALVPSFMEAEKTTEELIKQVEKLGKALKDATPEERAHILERTAQAEAKVKEEVAKAEAAVSSATKVLERYQQIYADQLAYVERNNMRQQEATAHLKKFKENVDSAKEALGKKRDALADANALLSEFNEKQEDLKKNSYVESLKEQAAQLGKTKYQILEMKLAQESLNDEQREAGALAIATIEAYDRQQEELKLLRDQHEKAYKTMQQNIERWSSTAEDAFGSMIDGSKSVSEAFKDMARSIVADLLKLQMQRTIGNPLKNALLGAFGTAAPVSDNSIFAAPIGSSSATTYALPQRTSPTMTPLPRAGGGQVAANMPYMVGERGAELFIPSQNGRISPNGSAGGQIVQNINVTTGVSQTVRAEIANLMPQIIQAAQGSMADSRLRGGSFSSAMGA